MSERAVFAAIILSVAIVAAAIALNDYGKAKIAMEHDYCDQVDPRNGSHWWAKCLPADHSPEHP